LPGACVSPLWVTILTLEMINLVRIDDEKNRARFYKLDVQPTLFREWALVRELGRIGQAGRVCVEMHDTRGKADTALIAKWAQKRKSG
jgi:predicted DNA-binding WGR domain protein